MSVSKAVKDADYQKFKSMFDKGMNKGIEVLRTHEMQNMSKIPKDKSKEFKK